MFKDLEKSEVQDEAETQMNKSIIVIGGESAEEMTCMTRIDEYIVAVSGKARPTVLYISTANGDDRLKISDFITKYESIGCTVICLTFFISPFPDAGHIASLFEQADVIYVAGGNTRAMLAIWREFGVVGLLRKAWEGALRCQCWSHLLVRLRPFRLWGSLCPDRRPGLTSRSVVSALQLRGRKSRVIC